MMSATASVVYTRTHHLLTADRRINVFPVRTHFSLKAPACCRPTKRMLMSFACSQPGLKILYLIMKLGPMICGEDLIVKHVISNALGHNPRSWKQKFARLALHLLIMPVIRRKPFFAACVTQKVILYYMLSEERSMQLRQLTIFTLKAVFSVACL